MTAPFVVLTGGSGAGKTTLANYFQKRYAAECDVFFFDSISVPSIEEMKANYGSGEAWQRAMTLQWITRISPSLSSRRPVLFEGQMRITFIKEALAVNNIRDACIVLIDCDDATRTARLQMNRNQPELANPVMMKWANYLRNEAMQDEAYVLNTGNQSFESSVAYLKSCLGITT